MLALAAAVSVLVHTTLGRAFQTVGHILQGMEDIEHGDYGKRLPRFGLPEFDRISATFNHMAQTLATARDENRALTLQSLQAQEEERRYLAQELHDELGQSLSAIKAMAASMRNTQGGAAAQTIMALCDRLFGVVRGMMRRLRPLMLDELGLIPSLQDMVENWRACHPGIDVRFVCDESVEDCVGGAKIHLFRIVQEALTNVAKHAQAATVLIELGNSEDRQIRLAVSDDGLGFDPARPSSGFGLRGMAERVASMDGHWTLDTEPGRGVALEIRIPCETLPP
jgi:two-component system sensor histidine kinase UhpB